MLLGISKVAMPSKVLAVRNLGFNARDSRTLLYAQVSLNTTTGAPLRAVSNIAICTLLSVDAVSKNTARLVGATLTILILLSVLPYE